MARMEGMSRIAEATKQIGMIVKGQAPFETGSIDAASAVLIEEAHAIPALFADRAQDPKSEALPAIWENWEDFSAKSAEGAAAAKALADASTPEELRVAFTSLGQSCKACHALYRE
jgi:cytochrome c556